MRKIVKISAFILIFLLISPPFMLAAERGSQVVVFKLDGTETAGELITVRKDSLILLGRASSRDSKILLADIQKIKVIKRSNLKKEFLHGIIVGAAAGAAIGLLFPGEAEQDSYYVWSNGGYGTAAGAVLGPVINGLSAADISYHLENLSKYEMVKMRDKLSKHARIREAN